jgi:hypothetical protein
MIKFPKGRASQRVVSEILAVASALDRDAGPILSPPVEDEDFLGRFTEPYIPDTMLPGAMLDQSLQPMGEDVSMPDEMGGIPGMVSRGDNLLEGF